jgi:hypothetical protein
VVNNHGDVDLHMAPPVGAVTVNNQNGNVTVTMPEKTKFNVQAETSDGDTHSDFDGVNSDGRGMLSGTVNGGGQTVRVNTSHGDISVSRNSAAPLPPLPPPPRLSGVPQIPPVPPVPPTPGLPSDAAAAIANAKVTAEQAKRDAQQAQRDAKQAAKEAMEQARQAMKEAQEKQREAMRLAREAAREK